MKENKQKSTALATGESLSHLVGRALNHYFTQLDGQVPTGLYDLYMAQVEPPLIKAVLHHTRGNKLRAAELLDLSRATLNTKMKKYKINAEKLASY